MAGKGGPKGHKNYFPAGTKDAKAEAYLVLRDAQIRAAKRVVKALDNEDDDVAMRAAKEIFDRLDGKAKQAVDNAHSGAISIKWDTSSE